MEVVVPDHQLSLAIGRRGQNVRLARQLTGREIDIVTEQEESEHRQAEFEKRSKLFIEAFNVDEMVGQLLASEGFNSVEELAMVDEKEMAGIEGSTRHRRRAAGPAPRISPPGRGRPRCQAPELGVEDALKEVPGVTTAMLVKFGENEIKTVEDPPAARPTICSAGASARTARPRAIPASSTASNCRARTPKR